MISVLLLLFHFAVPFALLLFRRAKQNLRVLAALAGAILVFRLLDYLWQIGPGRGSGGFRHIWIYLVVLIATGGSGHGKRSVLWTHLERTRMNTVSSPKQRSQAWEQKDVSGPALLRFVFCLGTAALVIHLAVGLLYRSLKSTGRALSFPRETPVVQWNAVPKPWLEIAGNSRAALSAPATYQWADRRKGIVQIPIDRAIELVAHGMITNETRK